ncbi:hypothetical protein [Sinosporangium siamense]|uniref:DUF1109 domain-containing protein n=2 Tax=Sinosporangium siamense TaxID=1367973 RepID=A0A919VBD6_9ACTN|nr:hypothetical protein [Sinosporangium siamense]GII97471.1 hypothetical protein Ssi02_77020 [Sinosporangium siamense]
MWVVIALLVGGAVTLAAVTIYKSVAPGIMWLFDPVVIFGWFGLFLAWFAAMIVAGLHRFPSWAAAAPPLIGVAAGLIAFTSLPTKAGVEMWESELRSHAVAVADGKVADGEHRIGPFTLDSAVKLPNGAAFTFDMSGWIFESYGMAYLPREGGDASKELSEKFTEFEHIGGPWYWVRSA